MLSRLIAVTLAACLATGCFSMKLERERRKALKRIDVEACEAGGGEIRQVCMFGIPACVQIFSDGGKPCRDSSECEGLCSVRYWEEGNAPKPGQPWVGECEPDNDRCGCSFLVENGLAGQAFCSD